MIGQTISHYKILQKLGEGGMGEVYLAEDTSLGRKVALKFLSSDKAADPESRQRFVHEARAQAMLSHPNIATFYEVGEQGEKVFIAMEYIEGQPLSKVAQTEKLSLPEILDLAIQVGEGLAAAHEKGVVHRDIKPENVLVTSKHHAKITDFGLAKWKGATTLTQTGARLGTAYYMSPEQVEGKKADHRTDIFSVGVVLYELLCARRPFEGDTDTAIFYDLINTHPQPLARYARNLPEKLEAIVFKCLAKKPEERYQSAADLVADLRKERKTIEYGGPITSDSRMTSPKRKWLAFLAPATVVLAVLLFLIFKPFQIKIDSEQKAAAEQNSLAVMYFDNVPDPEDKDRIVQMITALLITDLSESQYMQVVSRQRLYDILKLLGKENLKAIDKSVASEVAQKAGVKWIITGSVLQIKPSIVLVADMSEAATGKVKATQRITGEAGQDIFAVVDRLSAEIKKDLALPAQAAKEPDKPVANVTTHSPEAYRYYLEGLDYFNKQYVPEAEKSFRKAVELDSTFTMAYYRLAIIHVDDREGKEFLAKAAQYSDKVSQKEKHYMKALAAGLSGNVTEWIGELRKIVERYPDEKDAFFVLGLAYRNQSDYKEAVRNLTKAIEIDPLYKLAYNLLAYTYDQMGDFEKSIWAINKYISLAPEEANPYDTRGDLYANNGKLDLAIESYKRALEKKPDFYPSLIKLGYMNLFKREYVRAESCFQALAACGEKDSRSSGRLNLATIPLYQGKFEQALALLDQGIAADRFERAEGWPLAIKHVRKADIYDEKKNLKLALEEVKKTMEIVHRAIPQNIVYFRDFYAVLLAENGEIARAEEVAKTLKKDIEKKDTTAMKDYWFMAGWIELTKRNLPAAIAHFEKTAKATAGFPEHYMLAKAYLEAGRLGEAVAEFEKTLLKYDESRSYLPNWAVKAYYLLGLAYEKSGWNNKAIEKYQEFLEIWKDADPGIVEVEDAKARLVKLKGKV